MIAALVPFREFVDPVVIWVAATMIAFFVGFMLGRATAC